MLTVYSKKHHLHNLPVEIHGGETVSPFECPKRVEIILARLKKVALGAIIPPESFGLDPVLRVHDADYVRFLKTCHQEWKTAGYKGEAIANCWPSRSMPSSHIPESIGGKLGYYALACDTAISAGTWEAAQASKDVALTATKHVLNHGGSAFALCRPPGHHASTNQFGGYCFFGNAAIAAQYALDNGKSKVCILDVDFHHGNGSQQIFYDRSNVLVVSLHGNPKQAFPYFLGHADEHGEGEGKGFNINYPLPPSTEYAQWKEALKDALTKIKSFAPELLIVSLGVDTFENDPISFFKLKSEHFSDYGKLIAGANIDSVFVMEGGYAVEEIGVNTVNVLSGYLAAKNND